jgi:hypothetical protein
MPIPIKYTTTNVSSSVRLGNIALGVNAVDYGPSSTTNWANAVPPLNGGYAIYYYSGTALRMRTAADDATLITVAGQIMGTTYASADDALSGLAAGGFTVVYNNPPNIVTSGSVLNLNAGLVMSYPKTNTTWYDISGNINNGTLTNGPTFDSTSNSIVFDGTNDYINWTTDILSSLTSISYDVWVKFSSLQNAFLISCTTFKVYHQNNSIWYIAGITGNQNISWTFNNGWIHFSYSFDGVNHLCYINGVPYTVNAGGGLSCQSNLQISGRNSGNLPLNGNIASTKIYNRALSQSEILQNYYQGNIVTDGLVMALDAGNLVSYPGSGTAWTTLTGSNSGTLTNGPTFSSANGGAIVFDGVDDYVNISGSILPVGTGDYYVEAWVNRTTIPSNISKGIITGTSNNAFFFGFGTTYNGANGLRIGKSNILDGENCVFNFIANTWYHVAVTRISSTIYFYINGIQQTTQGSGTSNFSFVSSPGARIGAGGNISTILEPLYGNISSIKIYNRALSASEVFQNFNAQRNRFNL